MLSGRIFILPVIIVIIVGVGAYYYFFWEPTTTTTTSTTVPAASKTTLNLNPGFDYEESGWFSNLTITDWRSDGYYQRGAINGRDGIVIIHPLSVTEPRYIEQDTDLPSGKGYTLEVSLANIASEFPPVVCDDNIFKIKIIDSSTRETEVLSEETVNGLDGWIDLTFDISHYAGKTITVRIESHAGGPCSDWDGEWGAVDYVGIIEA